MAGVSAAAISALAGCISAGTSVAGTTLNAVLGGVDYNVACGVEVSNWTKFLMEDPCVSAHGGLIKTPPVLVLPGEKEIMVTHKVGNTACGTYGVVSWRIHGSRVHVMWSVPFNHDYFENWLAIGISPSTTHHDTYNQMYNDSDSWFRRQSFGSRGTSTLTYSNNELKVTGTMGTSHKPTVSISVRPNFDRDYCESIKRKLNIT